MGVRGWEESMDNGRPRNQVKQQAKQDRSVIDHLIHTFQRVPGEQSSEHTVVRSEAIYNQIRRTWSPDQHVLYRTR
jgi:hypothetical protein